MIFGAVHVPALHLSDEGRTDMIDIYETGPKRLDVVARGTLDECAVEAAAAELDEGTQNARVA